jgi:hypothetical protein
MPEVPAAGQLVTANASKILAYGQLKEPLQFGSQQHTWPFILAAINQAILGADFLHASGLLVDVQCQRLVDRQTLSTHVGASGVRTAAAGQLGIRAVSAADVSRWSGGSAGSRGRDEQLGYAG